MSAALHLAKPADLAKLCTMVAAFHTEEGLSSTEESRQAGIAPLLDGIPHGAAYLIGPARAPMGYIIVTFSWSVEFGGMDGVIDEIYIRPAIRNRGIASEVLNTLPKALADAGIKTLHLEVDRQNEAAQRLYTRAGFAPSDRYLLMSKSL
ncbi:MAG: GNAT family N-acetyltransferase [Rhodobacteraceae bacterium]|nr:GNAT family N-acetyltransferase [Paracoccaceae bacterium]